MPLEKRILYNDPEPRDRPAKKARNEDVPAEDATQPHANETDSKTRIGKENRDKGGANKRKDKTQKKRRQDRAIEGIAKNSSESLPPSDPVVEKSRTSKKSKHFEGDGQPAATDNTGEPPKALAAARTEPSLAQLPQAVYKQTKSLSDIPEARILSFLKSQNINVSYHAAGPYPPSSFRPILDFTHLPTSELLSKCPFASFKNPTPIQAASWPFSLSGRDVIGVAETGSGKTLAFSLPCIESLMSSPRPHQPSNNHKTVYARAVVVSPTRELAMQTHAALSALAANVGLSVVCLYGGASKDEQRALLRQSRGGADIVVATPGRLKDFLAEGSVSLQSSRFAVLDEADRMLDKGFEDDVKLILGSCPSREQRQTLMFTATWPASVQGLAEGFMIDPVKIMIGAKMRAGENDEGNGDGQRSVELQANSRILQKVEVVDPRGKEQRLLQLLRETQQGKGRSDRILVFCLYKKEAVRVEQFLQRKGIQVASIHGDLKQEQRTRSLEAFKTGTTTVLVATDVAARGLDIPEVKLVINLTFPLTIEDYVHRIGRTGRAGKEGKAITLFTEHDKAHSGSLVNVLRAAEQDVPEDLLKFGTTVKRRAHDSYGTFFKDVDMSKKGTKITFD